MHKLCKHRTPFDPLPPTSTLYYTHNHLAAYGFHANNHAVGGSSSSSSTSSRNSSDYAPPHYIPSITGSPFDPSQPPHPNHQLCRHTTPFDPLPPPSTLYYTHNHVDGESSSSSSSSSSRSSSDEVHPHHHAIDENHANDDEIHDDDDEDSEIPSGTINLSELLDSDHNHHVGSEIPSRTIHEPEFPMRDSRGRLHV